MSGDFFFFWGVVTIGERMYWHLVGGGQEGYSASCRVPESPTAKGYPPVYADPIISYLHYVRTENRQMHPLGGQGSSFQESWEQGPGGTLMRAGDANDDRCP